VRDLWAYVLTPHLLACRSAQVSATFVGGNWNMGQMWFEAWFQEDTVDYSDVNEETPI
jgi:hypothetical protein